MIIKKNSFENKVIIEAPITLPTPRIKHFVFDSKATLLFFFFKKENVESYELFLHESISTKKGPLDHKNQYPNVWL